MHECDNQTKQNRLFIIVRKLTTMYFLSGGGRSIFFETRKKSKRRDTGVFLKVLCHKTLVLRHWALFFKF